MRHVKQSSCIAAYTPMDTKPGLLKQHACPSLPSLTIEQEISLQVNCTHP